MFVHTSPNMVSTASYSDDLARTNSTYRLVPAFKVRLQVRSRGLRLPVKQVLVQARHSCELRFSYATKLPSFSRLHSSTPPTFNETSSPAVPRSLPPRHPTINEPRVRCLQCTVDDIKTMNGLFAFCDSPASRTPC